LSSKRVIESRPLTLREAFDIMVKRSEQEPMLTEIQSKTLDYLKEFSGDRDLDVIKSGLEELEKLGVKKEVSVALIDICPSTIDEVFSIMQMDKEFSLTPETARKIIDIVSKTC
jgi:DNA-directed RNA polymerase subunit F